MSTYIEDKQIAIVFPNENKNDNSYILISYGGDNNLIDSRTNQRSKNYNPFAIGCNWQVLKDVVKASADCCGGMMYLYGKRHTTPEQYIKAWRKAMEKAITVDQVKELGLGKYLKGICRFTKEDRSTNSYYYNGLIMAGKTFLIEGDDIVFRFDLTDAEDRKLWEDYPNYANPIWKRFE